MTRLVLALPLILAACAAPASTQGTAGQGGSNTSPVYSITVNIGTGGGTSTTVTSVPAAAPSAASTATAAQTASNDVKADANLGTDAIKAVTPIPTLGGVTLPKPAPLPAPVEPTKNP
jgi:hypothetical protein